jgi:hypothetical protein
MYNFPKASLINNKITFNNNDEFDAAIRYGVFYLKIADNFNVEPGWKYCSSFYKESKDNPYFGFKNFVFKDSLFGYTLKPDQIEQIQLEKELWNKYFPNELVTLLNQMNAIGVQIIQDIFQYIGIPRNDWEAITGGIPTKPSLQYVIFNHFRSEINKVGGNEHKDSGFVTVLCMKEEGQETFIDNEWWPVLPVENHFCINIGHSFEILTANLDKPVNATYHKVVRTTKKPGEQDRHTFGTYIGPKFDMNLFQYTFSGELNVFMPFIDFQKNKAREMKYEFHPKVKNFL